MLEDYSNLKRREIKRIKVNENFLPAKNKACKLIRSFFAFNHDV
jgi:hypothetical protein